MILDEQMRIFMVIGGILDEQLRIRKARHSLAKNGVRFFFFEHAIRRNTPYLQNAECSYQEEHQN